MEIKVKSTNLDLTPPLNEYIEDKFGSLERFVEKFDKEGTAEARVEVARTTRHHHKGNVFRAEVNLRLAGGILRAEATAQDIRTAIGKVKDKLQRQIKDYKKGK